MTGLGVHLALDQRFKKTLCVTYFTELILVSFGNVPVNKSIHYVFDILLGLFRDHYVILQRIKSGTICKIIQ